MVSRANLIKSVPREQWIERAHAFFADHDVLITPMFATLPPAARPLECTRLDPQHPDRDPIHAVSGSLGSCWVSYHVGSRRA